MKNLNFFIGGETETIVVYETIQTTYLGSPASSECISKLAGIKSQPWAMNVNGTPRLTIFFPILKLRTKVYIFIMRMKKNCLKNGICLESLFFFPLAWPNHLPKALSPNTITLEIRFQNMNLVVAGWEGTQTFSI